MQTLKTITEYLARNHSVTLEIRHVHNEHGRTWEDEQRGNLECRINAAADWAAREAAMFSPRFDGAATPQQDEVGSYTTFSANGRRCEGNIREVIEAKGIGPAQFCVNATPFMGRTARYAETGEVHTRATIIARTLMRAQTLEGHVRALFEGSRASMPSLEATAKRDELSSGMATYLSDCGASNRHLCPSCYDLDTGEGTPDSLNHLRHECNDQTMKAIRA